MEGYSNTNMFSSNLAELETVPEKPEMSSRELKGSPEPQETPVQEETYSESVVFPKETFQNAVREESKEPSLPIKETFNFQTFINSDYFILALLVSILAGLYYYFN